MLVSRPINILSIDFDWIMEPSISIYNMPITREKTIEMLQKESPAAILLADLDKFKQLNIYACNIAEKLPDRSHLVFARDHEEIVKAIKDWKVKDIKYNIYNIDHHHDCGYIPEYDKMKAEGMGCANWVMFCNSLQEYVWINNKNSETLISDDLVDHIPNFKHTTDINIINYVKFDYIFVCLSPEWIPKRYFPLYDTLQFNMEKVTPPIKEDKK